MLLLVGSVCQRAYCVVASKTSGHLCYLVWQWEHSFVGKVSWLHSCLFYLIQLNRSRSPITFVVDGYFAMLKGALLYGALVRLFSSQTQPPMEFEDQDAADF